MASVKGQGSDFDLGNELQIALTRLETLGEDLDRYLGVVEGRARAVVEASELLKDLGVGGILSEHSLIRFLGGEKLGRGKSELMFKARNSTATTHVLLLLVDVADLEPDVNLGERSRRILQYVAEALQKRGRRDQSCCLSGASFDQPLTSRL